MAKGRKRPTLDGWNVGVGALVLSVIAYFFWRGWDDHGIDGLITTALILIAVFVVWTDKRLH